MTFKKTNYINFKELTFKIGDRVKIPVLEEFGIGIVKEIKEDSVIVDIGYCLTEIKNINLIHYEITTI
jgi:hypothetical protein